MANGKEKVASPVASNDFVKSNGLDRSVHEVMPGGPSMTRQEFAAECDINNIMAQYDPYLSNPMKSLREPMYVDFTQMPDTLMGAMDVYHKAAEAFMNLPAKVRKEFDNDPAAFVDFASDPENLPQMQEWDLAPKPAPAVAPVVGPVPAAGAVPAPAPAPAAPGAPQGAPSASATHGST